MVFTGIEILDHIIAAVIVAVGLIACFSGYRLFKLFLAFSGYIITMLITFTIIYYFITPNLIIASSISSGIGIFGAIGVTYLPALGVFCIGSFFGFIASLLLIFSIRIDYMQEDDTRDVIMLALSIAMGFLSLKNKKMTVLVGTSLLGSFCASTGFDHWGNSGFNKIIDNIMNYSFYNINIDGAFIGLTVAFFVLFIIGALVQYFITGKLEERDLSVSGQLPISVPKPYCCKPYFGLIRKKIYTDEVPLLDVITIED